jgi:lipopolysaccharide transport system permease protein
MNRALLLNFTKQDFIDRYSGSVLGVGWAFIWPIVMIFIYTVIFGRIMGSRVPGVSSVYGYSIYLVSALVPWTAFANTVVRSSTVFVEKKPVITKVSLSLLSLPFFIVISESITMIITMTLFILFLLATGFPLHKSLVFFPFIYAVQQIFAYALGLFFGIFNVFVRDIREFVGVLMQLWFWVTPIVYVLTVVPPKFAVALHYNPAYVFIVSYQDIFTSNIVPPVQGLIKLVIIAHGLLLVTYLLFKWLERDIRDFL